MPPEETARALSDQATSAVVYFANCPEHGLHGERDECFVCGKPVDHVAYVRADLHARVDAVRGRHAQEVRRLRAENEALKGSWQIDADHRDELFVAVEKAYRQLSNTNPAKREKWVNHALTTLANAVSGATDDNDAPKET